MYKNLFICLVFIVIVYTLIKISSEDTMRKPISPWKKNISVEEEEHMCKYLINATNNFLNASGINQTCTFLGDFENCEHHFEKLKFVAQPMTVFSRASACEIFNNDVMDYEKEEELYPIAFSILTFG